MALAARNSAGGKGVATDDTVVSVVSAFRETVGMGADGDAADDPAIWVNPNNAAKSLILGANKDQGLYVYNLAGEELQKKPGRPVEQCRSTRQSGGVQQ